MVVTIFFFILIFGILVISHEFGHFLIGKRSGIRVNEFTVGMGPKLFSIKKGETDYVLRLLPIGGACVFDGMDVVDQEKEAEHDLDERSFLHAPLGRRIATVLAGPIANFILALAFSIILTAFCGVDLPIVEKVAEESAASAAGLQAGDEIVKMGRSRIHYYRDIQIMSAMNVDGESFDVTYKRDGAIYRTVVQPTYSAEDDRYYIGIMGGTTYMKCNPIQVFEYGFYECSYWVRYTIKSLGMLFGGKIGVDSLSGPVGMAEIVNDTYETSKSYGVSSVILSMMNLLVLLSVNLGVLNLLPIPALDGGRLLFLLVELITGKPIPPEKEGYIHLAGMVALMILMVVVLYNDIARLFH